MAQQTFMMIKPDAVARNKVGEVLGRVEGAGLTIRRLRMLQLTAAEAREFYKVHEGKPFLDGLCAFMSSGPIVALVVEGERAIERLAEIVGATDPQKAAPGTIRRDIGIDIEKNSVHRSDAPETAAAEIAYFGLELSLR
jgi:nucleoside-diphosphate kinase